MREIGSGAAKTPKISTLWRLAEARDVSEDSAEDRISTWLYFGLRMLSTNEISPRRLYVRLYFYVRGSSG